MPQALLRHACPQPVRSTQTRPHTLPSCSALPAKKSLGQNFLSNPDILQRIAQAAKICPGEPILEVGPGLGGLTQAILDQGAQVTAVEKDRRLKRQLMDKFPTAKFVEADILQLDLEELVGTVLQDHRQSGTERLKVVGNLPYYITQDFLHQLLPLGHLVSHAVLLLQEEAALRLTQIVPGAPDYRAATVEVQYYSQTKCLFTVPRAEFDPIPKVNGVVVEFALRKPAERPLADTDAFLAMVRQAFSTKRKMLRNSLQPMFELAQITSGLEAAGLGATLRPQQLSLDQYVMLYKALHPD